MTQKMSNSRFVGYFERKVRSTIRKYKLFTQKDKIAVAVSGGKDSTVCLYVLKKLGYDVEAVTVNAYIGNYSKDNLKNLQAVCKQYDVKLNEISFREEFGKSLCYMRSVLNSKGYNYSSCMLCGILKRYLLNKYSRSLGFNVLATGHNLDDEAQAFLMNVFRNDYSRAARQGPKPGVARSAKFVQRVKPLYLMSEDEVTRYSKIMKFPVNYGICPCSVDAYRRQFVNLLKEFGKKHPSVCYNIVKFHESFSANMKKQKGKEIEFCKSCGEPASGQICKTCELFKALES